VIDLVIRNGWVVTPRGIVSGGLAVKDGIIVQIGADLSLPEAEQTVDARGLIVFPGIIDPHQHIGLGMAQDEAKFVKDITTESVSAAVGGVTTLISTMGGLNAETSVPPLEMSRNAAAKHSIVDFKFHVAPITDPLIAEIPTMIDRYGVTSFKFPLGYIGAEGRHFGITWFDMGMVYRGFEAIARHPVPAVPMVHAEESSIIETLATRLKAEGRADVRAWSEARPNICETIHVFESGLIALELGCPLYVVHVSARESVDAVAWLKERGVKVYGETTPHYLAPITKDCDLGLIAKVNPPLRDQEDCDRLWKGLAQETLDTIGSDNCIYSRQEKERGGLWDSIVGFSGTGAILPIMVDEGVLKRRISWERMAQVCAENTARIFGIYPKKGVLSPGSDADIVIIDPYREWTMGVDTLKQGSDFSVYEGRRARGKAVKTFVRGKLVAEEGEPVIEPPHGAYVGRV
jgi:dihydropyrimidinase